MMGNLFKWYLRELKKEYVIRKNNFDQALLEVKQTWKGKRK